MLKIKNQGGFTLVELLIVVVILGILAAVGLGQFQNARRKSLDAERKQALEAVARALEMYYNDHDSYPPEGELGWGGSLQDTAGTVYMKKLPSDPGGASYIYNLTDNGGYKLYAYLTNSNDPDYGTYDPACITGENGSCHYCIASSNENCD